MDDLATPILFRAAAFNPAIVLEAIEQSRHGGAFDPHPIRDLLLGEFISTLGKMHKRPPFSLAEAERPQTLVELCAPGAGGPEEDQAELVDIEWRHAGKN